MKNAITRTKLTCVSMSTIISEDAARMASLMQSAAETDIADRIADAETLRTKAIELANRVKYLHKLTSRAPANPANRAAQFADAAKLFDANFRAAERRYGESDAAYAARCVVYPNVDSSPVINESEVRYFLSGYGKLSDEMIEMVIAYMREHCRDMYLTTSARPWSESQGCRCASPGGRIEKHKEGCYFAR